MERALRGAVVAGVWGAGKSTVCQQIRTRIVAAGCESLICVPQAATITTHTYTSGTASDHAAGLLSWMDELTGFLTAVDHRFHASTLPGHRFAPAWTPTALLEALSFDIPVYRLPAERAALLEIEHALADLGLHLVMLHVPDHHVQAQCIESTRSHRGPKWATYLEHFGPTDLQRAAAVCRTQQRLLEWVDTSPLPATIIDTSGRDWACYADRITSLILTPGPATQTRPLAHQPR